MSIPGCHDPTCIGQMCVTIVVQTKQQYRPDQITRDGIGKEGKCGHIAVNKSAKRMRIILF